MDTFLTIVVPAHNEARRLPGSLPRIRAFLASQPYPSEVIVVDSGSTDATAEVALRLGEGWPGFRVLAAGRPGKGLAVRHGMQAARGDYRFICDADLSMPIDELPRFLPPALPEVDIAIASREAAGSRRYNEPAYRHLVGRVFNQLVRWLAIPEIHDTQCGFKLFRGTVADDLFSVQQLDGWTFDVEVLYIALRRGYRLVEVPIAWTHYPGSRVRLVRDSVAMFLDLFRIRRAWRRGEYARR